MSKIAAISKQLTGSGVVTAAGKSGRLHGYSLGLGTAAQSTVTFRDGGVAGTIRWVDGGAAVAVAGDTYKACTFPVPIQFSTDIYAVLTGTGATVCVEYEQE